MKEQKDLIKSNIQLAKQFSYTTRYIDNIKINNNRFATVIPDVHMYILLS